MNFTKTEIDALCSLCRSYANDMVILARRGSTMSTAGPPQPNAGEVFSALEKALTRMACLDQSSAKALIAKMLA